MILNYTLPHAEKLILAGIKKHTIREDRKERWKAGMKIHHATGARSKKYKCFLENSVVSTQQILIVINKRNKMIIHVDRKKIRFAKQVALFINDGFIDSNDFSFKNCLQSQENFKEWFFPLDKKRWRRKKTMFSGKIIHWTNLKY